MTKPTRKQIILIITALVILGALIYGFLPGAATVQTEVVASAPMQVIVEEEGETFVEQHYIISSPVAAFVRRIDLDPGDIVEAGAPLIELEPPRSILLDPRSQLEADARIEAAEASLEQAETAARQAVNERDRLERLFEAESATHQNVELARSEASRALASRNAARAELAAARAASGSGDLENYPVRHIVRSPVAGSILAIYEKSERFVNPGVPLLEIGDIHQLEVRVEVLSQDAVRITPGMRVLRSEEHTSELQSRGHLVCRLLLEKTMMNNY